MVGDEPTKLGDLVCVSMKQARRRTVACIGQCRLQITYHSAE